MKPMVHLIAALVACLPLDVRAADDETVPDLKVSTPLSQAERAATVRLTRLRSVRLWWNGDNRVVGVSLKGSDANNQAVALASQLPGIRTLVIVALPTNHLTNEGLAPVAQIPDLQLLSLAGGQLTDQALTAIQGSNSLRAVILHGNFTDAALPIITTLPNLQQLDLTQSRISDAAMAELTQLTSLETLILNGTRISEAGLQSVAQIKTLKNLYLGDTPLSDSAIPQLQQMEQLELLFIRHAGISAAGVAQLLPSLLPTCRVIHESGTYEGTRDRDVARVPSAEGQWQSAR